MSRIRTIQPRFLGSTSMFRVSREARLMFILLWLIADDAGRTYASPPVLAARLYAQDSDAPMFVPAWLDELEREGCIERYLVDEVEYLRIVRWRKHQKIDRPTPSRLPAAPSEPRAAREASRAAREESPESQQECGSSADGREKIFDGAARELVEQRLLDELEGILADARARGNNTPALGAVKMLGQRIGLWSGKRAPAGSGEPDKPTSMSPAEAHGLPDTRHLRG
jgi:hypothetical protein